MPNDPRTYRKPRADLFTVLLVLAWVGTLLAILCLWAELRDYGEKPWKGAPSASISTVADFV